MVREDGGNRGQILLDRHRKAGVSRQEESVFILLGIGVSNSSSF
jgi:hypothetical protein